MNSLSQTLYKVLVNTYYRLNAGFFLILLLFGFGILRGQDHLLLAVFFTESPTWLIIPGLLFIAYEVKVLIFIKNQCRLKQNSFLYVMHIYPAKVLYGEAAKVLLIISAPALAYLLFIFIVGLIHLKFFSLIALAVFVTISHTIGTFFIYNIFQKTPPERKYSKLLSRLNRFHTRKIWLVFSEWLIRKEPVFLLLTKAFSLTSVALCMATYNSFDYDMRFLNFGILIAFTANAIIPFHYVKFENTEMLWKRNLAHTYFKRFMEQGLSLIPLVLPELILIVNWPLKNCNLLDKVFLSIFGISYLLLSLNIQWIRAKPLKNFAIYMFWTFIIYTFLILLVSKNWWLILLNTVTAFLVLKNRYYKYEYQVGETT